MTMRLVVDLGMYLLAKNPANPGHFRLIFCHDVRFLHDTTND